jgi:hypothetical protein
LINNLNFFQDDYYLEKENNAKYLIKLMQKINSTLILYFDIKHIENKMEKNILGRNRN